MVNFGIHFCCQAFRIGGHSCCPLNLLYFSSSVTLSSFLPEPHSRVVQAVKCTTLGAQLTETEIGMASLECVQLGSSAFSQPQKTQTPPREVEIFYFYSFPFNFYFPSVPPESYLSITKNLIEVPPPPKKNDFLSMRNSIFLLSSNCIQLLRNCLFLLFNPVKDDPCAIRALIKHSTVRTSVSS